MNRIERYLLAFLEKAASRGKSQRVRSNRAEVNEDRIVIVTVQRDTTVAFNLRGTV